MIYVSWASQKEMAIEKIEDPEQLFEQLKQRLHVYVHCIVYVYMLCCEKKITLCVKHKTIVFDCF